MTFFYHQLCKKSEIVRAQTKEINFLRAQNQDMSSIKNHSDLFRVQIPLSHLLIPLLSIDMRDRFHPHKQRGCRCIPKWTHRAANHGRPTYTVQTLHI